VVWLVIEADHALWIDEHAGLKSGDLCGRRALARKLQTGNIWRLRRENAPAEWGGYNDLDMGTSVRLGKFANFGVAPLWSISDFPLHLLAKSPSLRLVKLFAEHLTSSPVRLPVRLGQRPSRLLSLFH